MQSQQPRSSFGLLMLPSIHLLVQGSVQSVSPLLQRCLHNAPLCHEGNSPQIPLPTPLIKAKGEVLITGDKKHVSTGNWERAGLNTTAHTTLTSAKSLWASSSFATRCCRSAHMCPLSIISISLNRKKERKHREKNKQFKQKQEKEFSPMREMCCWLSLFLGWLF